MTEVLQVRGLKEAEKAIYSYSKRMGDKVVLSALTNAARLFNRQAKKNAPIRTGRLRKAIQTRKSRIYNGRRNSKIGVYIRANPGKNRRDTKGAFYAGFVEDGWTDRGGHKHTGKKYIQKAFEAQRSAAIHVATSAIFAGSELIKRRLGLK